MSLLSCGEGTTQNDGKDVRAEKCSSQGQNLALTVFFVPRMKHTLFYENSLDNGIREYVGLCRYGGAQGRSFFIFTTHSRRVLRLGIGAIGLAD